MCLFHQRKWTLCRYRAWICPGASKEIQKKIQKIINPTLARSHCRFCAYLQNKTKSSTHTIVLRSRPPPCYVCLCIFEFFSFFLFFRNCAPPRRLLNVCLFICFSFLKNKLGIAHAPSAPRWILHSTGRQLVPMLERLPGFGRWGRSIYLSIYL